MSKEIQLGKNIRALRRAYGETQEKLGVALNIEKNTVSNYEKGIRTPSSEIVAEIAKHYTISVGELMYSDLSETGKISVDKDAFFRNIQEIFPIIESEKASRNEHFRRGNLYHKRLYGELKSSRLDTFENIENALNEYSLACEESDIKEEAAANTVGILYILCLMVKTAPRMVINKPAALMQIASKDRNTRNILENTNSDFEKEMQEAAEELSGPEFEEELDKLRTIIKKSPRLSDLADYYLALQYVWSFVDNDLDYEFNQRIGMEMMYSLVSVENYYAARFLRIQMESIGKSSQTVDDK